ncbi:MAG: hypothetical protein AAGK78_00725, partial [Planctomycetota bacterium]
AIGVFAAALFQCRVWIAEKLDVLTWRLRPAGDDRSQVLRTLALLDRRASRRDQGRPSHMTFARWVKDRRLARAADWALHAPAGVPAPGQALDACRDAVLDKFKSSGEDAAATSPMQLAYAPDPD